MPLVNTFDGGLSLRIDPTLIKNNNSTELVNTEPNTVSLTSAKNYLELLQTVDKSIYNFNDVWLSQKNQRNFIEYNKKLFYSDGISAPKVYSNAEYFLGIDKPSSKPSNTIGKNKEVINGIVAQTQTNYEIDFTLAESINGDLTAATYNYKISFVSSNINVLTKEKNIIVNNSNASVIISLPYSYGHKVKIYRQVGTDYLLVTETTLDVPRKIVDNVLSLTGKEKYVAGTPTVSGTVQYCETHYNKNLDYESPPSNFTNEITIKKGEIIKLTNLSTITDPQITSRRIYRLGSNLVKMTLVGETKPTENVYIDITSDLEVKHILISYKHYPPPKNLTALTEANGTFYGLVNNTLVFSEAGKPNSWPPENSFALRDTGTSILYTSQGLLVFCKTLTYMLLGNSSANYQLKLVSDKLGCVNSFSSVLIKNTPLWVSEEGICTLQQGSVTTISKSLLGLIQLDVLYTLVYDERFFILKTDGTFLVLDLRVGLRFYELKFKKPVQGMIVSKNKLYLSVDNKLCRAFEGEDLEFTYVSPKFTENNITSAKVYHKVYVKYTGNFTINFYINDKLAITKKINEDDVLELMPPTNKHRGNYCHVKIVGTGTIHAIDIAPIYSTYGRYRPKRDR